VLSERKVPYNDLVQVMDAIRSVELPASDALVAAQAATGAHTVKVALFTNIALGDAP
jgi:hypothetical protein